MCLVKHRFWTTDSGPRWITKIMHNWDHQKKAEKMSFYALFVTRKHNFGQISIFFLKLSHLDNLKRNSKKPLIISSFAQDTGFHLSCLEIPRFKCEKQRCKRNDDKVSTFWAENWVKCLRLTPGDLKSTQIYSWMYLHLRNVRSLTLTFGAGIWKMACF